MRFVYTVSMLALLAVASPALADDYVIMKVNNQDVAVSEAKAFWNGLFPSGEAPAFESVKPDVRDKILRGIMAEKLVYGEALAKGADKSEAVQKELEALKKKLVIRTFLDSKTGESITDADLKKEYDAVTAGEKDEREVRARHILLATEKEAKEARKKIEDGKSFEAVAREYSKDAGSAKQGGDLGYFTKDKMVKEFAEAAFSLKKGAVSEPVKTAFGWHIIKVEDSRNVVPPSFESMKDQLRANLQERRLNDYVTGLVKSADVEVFDAKGKAMPFDKNLPTPEKPAAHVNTKSAPLIVKVDKPAAKSDVQ